MLFDWFVGFQIRLRSIKFYHTQNMKKLIILALCLVALLSCAIAETEAQIANEPVRGTYSMSALSP